MGVGMILHDETLCCHAIHQPSRERSPIAPRSPRNNQHMRYLQFHIVTCLTPDPRPQQNVDCEDERSSLGSPRYRHGDGDLRVEHVSPREPHGDASASRCYTETGQMGGMGVFEGSGFAFAGESVDHCRRTGPDPAAALTTQGQIDAATEALSVTREMTPHSPRKQHSDDERLRLGHPARSPVFNFYAPSEVARRNHRVYRTYGGCHRLPPRVDMPLTSAGKSQRTKVPCPTTLPRRWPLLPRNFHVQCSAVQ